MKKLMLFMFLALSMVACHKEEPIQTDLYIYLDFTEGQDYSAQLEGDAKKYVQLLGVDDEELSAYGTIKIYPLHDVSASVSKTVKLKKGKSKFEENRFLRIKEIDDFTEKLIDKATQVNDQFTAKELNSSHIFAPICKGVKKLNKSDADRKVILIYSDMLENSELANFHSKNLIFETLKKNFDAACDMEDTSDIEWHIVHPVDKKNDQKIQKAEDLWTKYLSEKGVDEDMFHFDTSIDL